ncbi:MAG TPA: hypothetical protein VNO50_11045 [Pyrinomonadaceae bacterium]|nr:hypothetical protein [Pyrinomonadaceae bacterium]
MNLKNVLSSVAKDVVALVKQDGTRTENVKAVVQSTEITIYDSSLNVEEGDRIERRLPSGRLESYLVLDTGFNPGHSPVPAFYQMKVRKESAIIDDRGSSSVVYNLTGPNARVNVNSTDSSTNVTNVNSAELFVKMRDVAGGIQDTERRQLLVERIEEMERSHGSQSFAKRYSEFISLAADHMSLFAPFMPALGQLLGP